MNTPVLPANFCTVKIKGSDYYCSPQHECILKNYSWSAGKKGYPQACINGKHVFLHRFIMGAAKGDPMVDHIDRCIRNVCIENLRFVTRLQNGQNKKRLGANLTGVRPSKNGKYFESLIVHNKTQHFLGKFDTEELAAVARDCYIVQHPELFHPLNFPERRESYLLMDTVVPKKQPAADTGLRGVFWDRGYIRACVVTGNKRVNLGSFNSIGEAARARDVYIVTNGLKCVMNYPEEYPDYQPTRKVKTIFTDCPSDPNAVQFSIPSRPGVIILIDRVDMDKVKFSTCVLSVDGYVRLSSGKALYREIMGVSDPDIFVDHINGNKNDQRRCNLRLSNATLNPQNLGKKRSGPTVSKYLGVSKRYRSGFVSSVRSTYVWGNKDEEKVARMRDLYIITNIPDSHYRLNFQWTPEDITHWRSILPSAPLSKKRARPGSNSDITE